MDGFVTLYIFILAAITGYEITSKAPSKLHTALMSGASLINAIVLIGAMIVMGQAETTIETMIGFMAVMLAAANAVGGYLMSADIFKLFTNSDKSEGGRQ